MTPAQAAEAFADLFPAVYLRLHTRRPRRPQALTPQMAGYLRHLASAGPLTVGEAASHLQRAQSVVSEMTDRLIERGLVERMSDGRDRRRKLVWLTEAGRAQLQRDEQVLSPELLSAAAGRMAPSDRNALIRGMRALVRAADSVARERRRRS
jgi:DNA-binding MarR family transcriptional regulator